MAKKKMPEMIQPDYIITMDSDELGLPRIKPLTGR